MRLPWQAAGPSQGTLSGSTCEGVGAGLKFKLYHLLPGENAAIRFFGARHSGNGFLNVGTQEVSARGADKGGGKQTTHCKGCRGQGRGKGGRVKTNEGVGAR